MFGESSSFLNFLMLAQLSVCEDIPNLCSVGTTNSFNMFYSWDMCWIWSWTQYKCSVWGPASTLHIQWPGILVLWWVLGKVYDSLNPCLQLIKWKVKYVSSIICTVKDSLHFSSESAWSRSKVTKVGQSHESKLKAMKVGQMVRSQNLVKNGMQE